MTGTGSREEILRLYRIMYQPRNVLLATDYGGDRWLTDRYVLLRVTDSSACSGLPDGAYRLTQRDGLAERPGGDVPPDIEAYFSQVFGCCDFRPVEPTQWSVAEHPGKARLFAGGDGPCFMGEPTWTALTASYENPLASYGYCPAIIDGRRKHNLFRITGSGSLIAVVAGIRCPDGQQAIAEAICEAHMAREATSDDSDSAGD